MALNDQIEQIKLIYKNLKDPENGGNDNPRFVLVIHSMDIGALKNEDYQRQLSEIAEIPYVTVIVSVDHIKAGMMWSE